MILVNSEEVTMGTWDAGPFDNDTAADFADALDEAEAAEREGMVRGVLIRTATATGYLFEAEQAVAAAALIAAQCPDGQPVDANHGPQTLMPVFPENLRMLADEALARVADDDAGLAADWFEAGAGGRWLAVINDLRRALNPPPSSMDVPLFDLDS